MGKRALGWMLVVGLSWACEDSTRARAEGEDGTIDVEVATDTGGDAALQDAGGLDASPRDRGMPLDEGPPVLDARAADASIPDAGAVRDAVADGAALTDAAADAAPAGTTLVSGEARAADARLQVVVSAEEAVVEAVQGAYQLDLPPGPHTLTFRAPDHETIEIEIEVGAEPVEVPPVLLYRGVRLGAEAGNTLQFRADGGYVVWSEGDALLGSPTDVVAPRVLLAEGLEIFLGFSPDGGQVAIRRRTEPGLAGDIDTIDLANALRRPLFQEAQPWVRWRPDGEALGMVATREALSRLVRGRPGAASEVLAEGVPWLLVTDLLAGEVAWAQRDGDAFAIYGGPLEAARPLAPGFPASDAFLSTLPARGGLFWLGPAGELTRWGPNEGASIMARDVLPTPRPRFQGEVLVFFRADDGGPALRRVVSSFRDQEYRLVDAADGDSVVISGGRLFAVQPDHGLWRGDLFGEGESVLPGDVVRFVVDGDGAVALADGIAYDVPTVGPARPLGVEGLSQLTAVRTGATAWQAATRTLWYLAGPSRALEPTPLVAGAPRAGRVEEPGSRALYVLGSEGYFRAPIPPGPPQTAFAVDVDSLAPIDAGHLLGWRDHDALFQIDPTTGEAFGWAADVRRVVVGGSTQAVYVSDRGTYLAPVGE